MLCGDGVGGLAVKDDFGLLEVAAGICDGGKFVSNVVDRLLERERGGGKGCRFPWQKSRMLFTNTIDKDCCTTEV